MSTNPATLRELGAYWTAHGGVNLGVVGDGRHTKGYHLGEDRIFDGAGPGLGGNDYSVQTARDRAGLSEAASAIDLGKLGGSLANLYAFSAWLVSRCRANAEGTRDVREVIYSDDGQRVLRWDRERGYSSAPRTGEADASHLAHTHVSFYRDSELRSKVPIFSPYFGPPETATEGHMKAKIVEPVWPGSTATTTQDTQLWRWDGTRVPLREGVTRSVFARCLIGDQEVPAFLIRAGGEQEMHWLREAHADFRGGPSDTKHRVAIAVDGTIVAATETEV